MASKFGMAGGLPERRVRPIWDAVDSRQFKTALKLTNALLSKYPSSPYAVALKALILERLGRLDEALVLCLSAKDQLFAGDAIYIDDLTLSTLQIVFQRLDRLDLATSCYEYACGKFPNNLELMMGLFNCYLREYSYVKQQQTAIKMYKAVGEERFLFWAVCSILLQVLCGEGGEKLLSLAEALIKKHNNSNTLREPEGFLLYISVLEQQGKYGDALELISGSLGSLISTEGDRLRMKGGLLARAHDYSAAAEVFQQILDSNPDDWKSFLDYLGCLLEDDCSVNSINAFDLRKTSHLPDDVFDSRMESASHFVGKLLANSNSEFVRGPYLARLELEKQCLLYGKIADGSLITNGVLEFFSRFGHLSSFSSDVELYLQVLTDSEKTELLDEIVKIYKSSSVSAINKLGQAVSIYKIQALCGTWRHLSIHDLEITASEMVELYCKSLPLSKDLDPQENMHGEELLSMACNLLVLLYYRTKDLGYLLEAVIVLEFGLAIRRFNWESKILLVHLYSHFGSLSSAYEWYKTLDVKNILLETVSHHIMPQMLKSPLWSNLSDLLDEYLKFMDDYFKEAADLTFLGYRHRNYTKVIEFVQFKQQLQDSHQYMMAKLEFPILQLKQKSESFDETEAFFETINNGVQLMELSSKESSKSLSFHEDFQTRPWWTPVVTQNCLEDPFDESSLLLIENKGRKGLQTEEFVKSAAHKLIENRSLLPRLVYLAIQSASSLREAAETNGFTNSFKYCSELKHLLERYAQTLGFSFDEAQRLVVGISEGSNNLKDFGSSVVDWMIFAVFVNVWNLTSHNVGSSKGDGDKSISWKIVNDIMEKLIREELESAQPLLSCPRLSTLSHLVQIITEPLSWHCLIIQSIIRSLTPVGKRKKRSGQTDQLQSPLAHAIKDSTQRLYDVVERVALWCRKQLDTSEDEKLDTLLSLLQGKECDSGSRCMLKFLEATTAAASSSEGGDRVSQALQTWSSADVLRKIIAGQSKTLLEFHHICTSKLKLLRSLQ